VGVAEDGNRRHVQRLRDPGGERGTQHPLGAPHVGLDHLGAQLRRRAQVVHRHAVHDGRHPATRLDQRRLVGQVAPHQLAAERRQPGRAVG
jgi:hypothetical protein